MNIPDTTKANGGNYGDVDNVSNYNGVGSILHVKTAGPPIVYTL